MLTPLVNQLLDSAHYRYLVGINYYEYPEVCLHRIDEMLPLSISYTLTAATLRRKLLNLTTPN